MSTTPNQKDLLAKKSDLEGILKPDDNDVLHLPDVTITLAESGQFYLAGIDKKLLTLVGNTSGNAVTLDGDAGLTFTTSEGSSTIAGITSSSGNSTNLAASQSMASAKQDALTAGTNITISNNTISATDTNTLSDLTDTAISSLADGQVLKYNATTGKWVNGTGGGGAEVILGTTAPTSAQGSNGNLYIQYDDTNNNTVTHEYVKISGAWEEIAVGGGGSSVIPNPQGTPTDTLDTVSIDGTIYEIQGSGGGGGTSKYTEEVLWSGNESTSRWAEPVVLNIDITDYDMLSIRCGASNENGGVHIILTSEIPSGDSTVSLGTFTENKYSIWLNKDNNILRIFTSTNVSINVKEVVGIKYGSGSGGGSGDSFITYTKTVTTTNYGWWTVEDKDGNVLDPDEYIIVDISIENDYKYDVLWSQRDNDTDCYFATLFQINDGLSVRSSTTYDWTITYAKKDFSGGGGGSSVTPNPTDPATDALTSIEIDGTVYSVGGGDASAEEITLSEYNELTTEEKNDGTIRFIPESSVGVTTPIDMSNPTNISESSRIVITPSEKSVEMTWDTSASTGIGATFYYSRIDVTDYDYLVYDLVTGDSYDSLHPTTQNPARDLGIGLCSSAPSTWGLAPNINWTIWNRYEVTDTNKNLGTQTLDVSELDGEYYLVIAGVAWEATISNLKYATSGGNPSQIKYMDKTYGISSGGGGSTFEGLDYANKISLNIPDATGYTYTPAENGALLLTGYGSASVICESTSELLNLKPYDDTYSTVWILIEKDVTYTIKKGGGSGSSFGSGSVLYFIPLKNSSSGGGGTGGGLVEDVLWSGSYTPADTSASQLVTLNKNISNYDALVFHIGYSTNYSGDILFLTDNLTIGNYYVGTIADGAYLIAYWKYTSDTSVTLYRYSSNGLTPTYMKITGLKFGSGGGGSSVTPNPQGTPTDTLSTIEIDGTTYDIEGSGGGSGGILKGLDYANAVTLTLPDHTGYDYTPTGYGVLMATSYGGAGCITIADQNEDAKYLSFRDDTWTTSWIPVTKDETYHVSRGSSSTDFPSGSWFKFIPWLCEGGGGASAMSDLTDVNLTSLANGQILKYDSTTSKWVNANESGGGGNAAEISLSNYDALPTAQKNDGTIRFIPESNIGATLPIDMSNITKYREPASNVDATSTTTDTTVTWDGGDHIGLTFYYTTPIDVTSWDKILFNLVTLNCYENRAQAKYVRWNIQVGLREEAPTEVSGDDVTSPSWVVCKDFAYSNTTYNNQELDVSGLTGQYYLMVNAHGWNATLSDFTLATVGGNTSQIKYMSKTYALDGDMHTYSTTEHKVGTWIDGSDVYERTVVISSTISQGNYATIISGENVDLLGINSDGCFLTRSNGQRWSIFGGYSGSGLLIYQETNGDIKLYNNSGVDFNNATITVTYLK